RPAKRERPVAFPGRGVATRPVQVEMNVRRTAPFPFSQEWPKPFRGERGECVRNNGAFDNEAKIIWGIVNIRAERTTLMPEPNIADHGARSVPGIATGQTLEPNVMIG